VPPLFPNRDECPYSDCDGSGFVVDETTNTASPCRCRPERVTRRRAQKLSQAIPRRFENLSFDRPPIDSIAHEAPEVVRSVRRYCDRIDDMLDAGEGMWFLGGPGTGKSHLAYLISQHALAAGRSVAIYTGPRLLDEIRRTYRDDDESGGTLALIDRLTSVELLHIDDLAVARPTDWVLEQLYNVINGRYENKRSIVFTCDLTDDRPQEEPGRAGDRGASESVSNSLDPKRLARHITQRNYSRLIEMCSDPLILAGRDHRQDYRDPAYEVDVAALRTPAA
jgi:DNA replication protein DnaC